MTIAVALNLADGLVLGTDSAITITRGDGRSHEYTDADKLFTIGNRPIAIATYGLAILGSRTIRSYVREFQQLCDDNQKASVGLEAVAGELWKFTNQKYLASAAEIKFQLPAPDQRGVLGFLVGGFSPGEFQSEVWDVRAEQDDPTLGARRIFAPGDLNAAWRGMHDGLSRFHSGVEMGAVGQIIGAIAAHYKLAMPLDPEVLAEVHKVMASHNFDVQVYGMPLQEGVSYVRFLLDMMINESRFVSGKAGCGGSVRMIVVQSEETTWVTDSKFRVTH